MPLIAKGLCYTYNRGEPDEVKALNGIDLTIEAGELVLVAGPNGSGKTTLMQCLSGLLKPASGSVIIDGVDAVKCGFTAMSIQFPERALFERTVLDDVTFGPLNRGKGKEEARQCAIRAIEAVGLGDDALLARPMSLSQGQRRLAALAGVIAAGPRYLFLDEPTAGLDSNGKERVARIMAGLARGGMAVVVASHDLAHLMGVCGRMIVLDKGRVAMDGRPGDIVSLEGLERMGLALPPSAAVARWLRGKGVDAPWDIGPEEAAEHLRRILHEGTRMD
ncbi:ATP-binding cassette domain-containing protein [Methanocella conradii]|uniref:ATP-binding cassette domain-containing protein n=1 Tax=Methanocella conradii TaxID=1175444 RepID=UPI0024B39578|nr:ATP-binding cassette domain-containing protein [Methanocella conradii]MDI6897018.1 ATP-binding cassette domain-containing protein [Methanocella conradii]